MLIYPVVRSEALFSTNQGFLTVNVFYWCAVTLEGYVIGSVTSMWLLLTLVFLFYKIFLHGFSASILYCWAEFKTPTTANIQVAFLLPPRMNWRWIRVTSSRFCAICFYRFDFQRYNFTEFWPLLIVRPMAMAAIRTIAPLISPPSIGPVTKSSIRVVPTLTKVLRL